MLIKTSKNSLTRCAESEVTSESAYLSRRQFIRSLALGSTLLASSSSAGILDFFNKDAKVSEKSNSIGQSLNFEKSPPFSEKLTSEQSITHYNNFYEFGLGKAEPAKQAKNFVTEPWSIQIEGEAEKTGKIHFEDILKAQSLQERIYRLRCVEAWSMVIPWVGFPLAEFLKRFNPNSNAKYVEFHTLYDPKQMPGQKPGVFGFSSLQWPYVEGLTIAEAMNPLSFIAVGLYGKILPPQNGAPLRLVVPWKYGFKNIKSIVKIKFTAMRPKNSWAVQLPNEYGFYANVNPKVDHPRWSQATERRIVDSSLFSVKRIPTLPFNGYGEQVASLYQGLDLRKFF